MSIFLPNEVWLSLQRRRSKELILLLLPFLVHMTTHAQPDRRPPERLTIPTWSEGPKLPVAVSSGFVGMAQGKLLVAGGSNFPTPKWEGGQKTYYQDIYAVPDGSSDKWAKVGVLPRPMADGAAVETPDGLLCLGGTDGNTVFDDVFLLKWDAGHRQVSVQADFPKLPMPLSHLSACRLGNVVYVMGGQQRTNEPVAAYYKLDLAKKNTGWQALRPQKNAPPARFGASLVVQNNGDVDQIYLMSGKGVGGVFLRDAYAFNPKTDTELLGRWKRLADLPRPAFLAPHAAVGPAHILLFSGSDGHDMDKAATARGLADYQFTTGVLAYHTITNTWSEANDMPLGLVGSRAIPWQHGLTWPGLIIPGGEISPGVRTDRVQMATLPTVSTKALFGGADYAVLGGYLVLLAAISLFFARRNNSADDYLLGGQRVPAWAAGISVMATQVSAIGFMTIPAKVYAVNWAYFVGVFTWFIVVPIVAYQFIPLIRRLKVTSVYEYLERRFDGRVRLLAATLFILFQLGRMGLVLYLPALALSAVTPLNTLTCILLIGVLSTVYTVLGGIEGVIWIEVVQTLVLFCGAIVCIGLAINGLDGGLGTFWQVANADQKFSFGTWDWDLTAPTLVVLVVGNIFIRLGNLTTDQAVVQRYLTTPDVREAQKTLWTDVATSIPWAIVVYLLGTALYVYYQQHPAEVGLMLRTDSILPHFVSQNAPFGLSGLIIAGIFAASMSSSESHIHSLATILTTDFYRYVGPARFNHGGPAALTPEQTYRVARFFTVALGLLSTGLALSLLYLDIRSLLDFFQELTGLFIGSSAGLFALGMASRRTNATGAMIGAVGSIIALGLVKAYTPLNFWLYSAVGFLVCVVLGYVASLVLSGRSQTEGLTMWSLQEKKSLTPG